VVSAYTASKTPVFLTPLNLGNLLVLALPLGFVALGQQYTMISGLFDISVGSAMSLAVVLVSITLPDMAPTSVALTLVVLAVAGVAIGGFNALLIEKLNVSALVATVATMSIVQGIAILLRPNVDGVIAPDLVSLVSQGIGFVPGSFIGLCVVAALMEFWLHRRRGLALRAVGFNGESSLRVGERVSRIRATGLVVCAFGAIIGGVFLASQTGMGSNSVGSGYALPCFTAVFLGGAVLTGGRGSFIGAVLGAVFIGLINNVTPLLGIPSATQQVLYGLILIIAIATYASMDRAGSRKMT
jgi:ribose transport system ATP-binding protein